ncbi:unnamed protein product [Chironomus riparius]|uniref:Protein sleepless n=1 Tax=Chironomus riparius TaxID=315576 RepID=A0A9N9S347_9DIPT|nr:unnamed protein product [Chironomus riparius]
MNQNILLVVPLIIFIYLIKNTTSTSCYQCNSYINPSCGDPFRSHFFVRNVVNCTEEAERRHINLTDSKTFCRKNIQIVDETVRIIRDCGFYHGRANEQERCVRRFGSENIKLWNCACDEDYCNGSRTLSSQGFWMIICAVFAVTFERLNSMFK